MSEAAHLDTSPDSPAGALAALRSDLAELTEVEIRRYRHTLDFVTMNLVEADSADAAVHFDAGSFGDQEMLLAGPGAPAVSEFAVAELAAALGMSTEAGKHQVGALMEIRYRLPLLHRRVLAGAVPVWRARRIAEHTRHLPAAGAAWVDEQLAPFAGSCSWAQVSEPSRPRGSAACVGRRGRVSPATELARSRRAHRDPVPA